MDQLDDHLTRIGQRLRSLPELGKAMPFCGMGVPCAVMDTHLRVYRCNLECGSLFGIHDVEMVGKRLYDLCGELMCAERREIIDTAVSSGISQHAVGAIRGILLRTSYMPLREFLTANQEMDTELQNLVSCVHTVCLEKDIDQDSDRSNWHLLRYHDFGDFNSLTDLERQVLARVVRGQSNAQISEELYKSVRTIEGYRRKIAQKTGHTQMTELISAAATAGFRALPLDRLELSVR